MLRILANDFGQHHGFTLFERKSPTNYTLTSWEVLLGERGHVELRNHFRRILTPETIFLGERFLFLKDNQTRDKIDYMAAEYIGVAKVYCMMNNITMEWQNASQACGKTAFWGDGLEGNTKIRRLGLWQPGKRHAMDALRHTLYYLSFELGHDDFIQQLKD